MHRVAEGDRVNILDQREQVIGVEHRVLRDPSEPLGPLRADVAVGPKQHARVAEEGPDPTDRPGPVVVEEIGTIIPAADDRSGKVGRQVLADRDWPCTGPASAMRTA